MIETNVRKAVLGLLDPILIKLNKERENVEKTKQYVNSQTKRIEQLEAAVIIRNHT